MQQPRMLCLMQLTDIGLNLTHDSFDHDRDAVLQRAQAAGVQHMIVTGADVTGSRQALKFAEQNPDLLSCTAGVHPHHASDWSVETVPQLRDMARQAGVVAIGECGLDFFRNFSPPAAQEKAFQAQLELATELNLPLFLHQRDAHASFLAMLREHQSRGVAHCFTGTIAEAEDYLALGLSIGITGWLCDERRGQALREAVKVIPAEHLLLETDAPYLLPRDLAPKPKTSRNEPQYLPHILHTLAACRQEDPGDLAATTTANAQRLFSLNF